MEGMEHDLESIGLRVQDMAKASQALMGVSTDDQNSFFLQMEGQFTAILKMLGTCAAAQKELESTAAGLEKTISSMQDWRAISEALRSGSSGLRPTPRSGRLTLEREEMP